jgi:hypothetical protein
MERLRDVLESGYAGGTAYMEYLTSAARLARFIASPESVEAVARALSKATPSPDVDMAFMWQHRMAEAEAILSLLAQKALDDGS